VPILSTFYEKLFFPQIPKAQKYSQAVSLFAPLGSVSVKAAHKMLVKLTPSLQKMNKIRNRLA